MKFNYKSKLSIVAVFAVLGLGGASLGVAHALSSNNSTLTVNSSSDKETNDDGNNNTKSTQDNSKDGEVQDDLSR